MSAADRDLLDAAPAGFLTFRDDGVITAVNETLLDLLGYARGDVIGRHVEGVLGVAGRIFFQTHLFPLVRMHGEAEEIYIELRSRAGHRIPVLLNARRRDSDATHCVLMRVRERKKFEEELLRAKKAAEAAHAEALAATEAKSHYLRSVSHEIRTPINALLGYADLLELNAGRPMGETQMGYVQRVRHAARHLLTLVNDILDLAKIESGAMTVESDPRDLGSAADAAMALVEPQAAEKGITLARASTKEPGRYRGDHERVVQILVNLLSNAVKFTDPGGRVDLDWCTVVDPEDSAPEDSAPEDSALDDGGGPWIRAHVADTGIGIPPERMDDLFVPFSQITGPASDPRSGTGLGLTISRELARLMGGEITVRSQPGAGSTFSLWLPAAR